ncbi:hypothetical protein [Spiroplasma endosymbiont of 'Nebria riversi']|uniref:hypothetical protein n=1 Tax=Spiroplasma endosymbiont of 'Nebria riversi' TaxID=2792084 RepID=UPI001C0416CE|nr:hypothetical protein [Spiroplasma endosymbiont of 'Nebria riversi']
MVSYLLSISYDGSKYWGWARQNNKITVEGSLMAVITSAFNCEFWYGAPFLDNFYVDCHFLNSTGVK